MTIGMQKNWNVFLKHNENKINAFYSCKKPNPNPEKVLLLALLMKSL